MTILIYIIFTLYKTQRQTYRCGGLLSGLLATSSRLVGWGLEGETPVHIEAASRTDVKTIMVEPSPRHFSNRMRSRKRRSGAPKSGFNFCKA